MDFVLIFRALIFGLCFLFLVFASFPLVLSVFFTSFPPVLSVFFRGFSHFSYLTSFDPHFGHKLNSSATLTILSDGTRECKITLETGGEDDKTTLETGGEDGNTTLETGGEDGKTTLDTSEELRFKS